MPGVSPVKLLEAVAMPLTLIHVDDVDAFHWRLYVAAPETAVQFTVALVVVMPDEFKPVGVAQVADVVNDVVLLNELDPDPPEQTVCTWKSYDVLGASPVRPREVVVSPLMAVHVDDDVGFHWRL